MDSLLQFQLILFSTLLALLFSVYFNGLKRPTTGKARSFSRAPQAGGAWPIIGHMHLFGGKQLTHKILGAMADKYGPVFTIKLGSHRVLVVNSWEMARDCFTVHDRAFSSRPSNIAASKVETAIRDLHKMWVSKGSAESGVTVDMKQWFGELTLNIVLRMVGGKRYFGPSADGEEAEARRNQKVMRDFVCLFGVFVLSDAIPFLGWLDFNGYEKTMKRTAKELDILVGGWLEEHKQRRLLGGKEKQEQDFMDAMLNISEKANIAGSDTINKATCLAMFRAIGIGYSRSLPSAAALNWVLKDGLGRLSRCIYTASLASAFDTNLKRVRFTTSVLFSLSIGVELLTPTFPQYFLLLATLANIAKQISLACYLATGSAVHRSFAIADNIGEVSAKAQIQTVCFDNLGLMLAALLNMLFKNNQRLLAGLPFFVYPIFSAIDLFGIYQGLQHVHLQTLTKDRLEIILNSWIDFGHVPSPAEVSQEEGIDFLWTKNKELWPIRIGCLNTNSEIPKLSMMAMQSLTSEDYYFVCMESSCREWTRIKPRGILLCLREGSGTADVIMGLLQACYIRKALLFSSVWETAVEDKDASDLVFKEWFKLIDDSKQSAKRDLSTLNDQMGSLGWALKHILLSTEEQARYSFVDD